MDTMGMAVGVLALVVGAGIVVAALGAARRPETDPAEYLAALEAGEAVPDEFEQVLAQPFLSRVVRPLGQRVFGAIASLAPRNYLDRVHNSLVHAGLAGSVRAEEFVTAQVLATGFGLVAAVAWSVMGNPAPRLGVLAVVLLPAIGALAPSAWLNRKVAERKLAIRNDLPDVLDLMAISVEAGVAFEGAMEVVCRNFDSPLAEELSRTLKEMELGLPRREALQNLKRRTEVPELSNFVLALTQADALGMPVGRVLKTQAAEMRTRRRQWAREQAGKLPVKILFPLVGLIFPAILVVVLGPAAISIAKSL
jgi:tight adherence protein C